MNIGELKLQNALFNSQLQLNKDLLNSKSENISSFDDILKNRTEYKSIGNRDSFVYKDQIQQKLQQNTGDRFDIKNRAAFSKSNSIENKDLSTQINEEIAKSKFGNSDISQDNKIQSSISDKIKELEKAIKEELGLENIDLENVALENVDLLNGLNSDGENEIISEIAAMLGISEEVLVELLGSDITEINITQLAKELVDNPELVNLISTKIDMLAENADKDELVNFLEVLEEVIDEIPKSEIAELVKSELSKVVDGGYEKVELISETISENDSLVAVIGHEVKSAKSTEKTNGFVLNEKIEAETKVEEIKVEAKPSKEDSKFDSNISKESKSVTKPNLQTNDSAKSNFEDQVNIMKDQNTLITSAKNDIQPKTVLAKSITSQIVEGVKMSVKLSDVSSEILIKLNPKNLGNIALKMSFEKGVLLAQIIVENQTVKGLVESNLTDLKNALKDEGYLIGDLDVSVNKDDSEKRNHQSFGNSSKQFSDESFEEFEEEKDREDINVVNNSEVNYLT